MDTRPIVFLSVVLLLAQVASVDGSDLMDLFFASLDKNHDKLLSENEIRQLNWCVIYAHNFGDFWSKISKFISGNGLSLSDWRKMSFTAEEIQDLTKPFEEVPILF